MYELLTGRPPFTGDSPVAIAYQHVRENPIPPSRLDPSLPPWADSIVLKAMAKSPNDRYQSAAEMNADIQRAASGMQVAAAFQGAHDAFEARLHGVDGDHTRVENPDKVQAQTVLIDGAAKRLDVINDREKTYMELTEEDMKRALERFQAMKPQLEEAMKNMPPEQRKLIQDKLAGMGAGLDGKPAKPPEYKFDKLGEKKNINGIPCEVYRVLEDGKPREEDCLSPWSAGLIQKSDLEGIRKFGEEMAKSFGGAAGGQRDIFAHMDKYPGIPVSRVPLEADGTRGAEEQIKSVKRGSISAAKFTVPAGYTKKAMPMGGLGGAGGPHP